MRAFYPFLGKPHDPAPLKLNRHSKIAYSYTMALKVAEKLYASTIFCVQETDKAYFMEQILWLAVREIQARDIHTGTHHLSEHRLVERGRAKRTQIILVLTIGFFFYPFPKTTCLGSRAVIPAR